MPISGGQLPRPPSPTSHATPSVVALATSVPFVRCRCSQGGAHHPNQTACVQAPHQVEILEGTTLEQAQRMLQEANLTPPLLVKPLWTDGREGSHGLGVLHDMEALGRLLSGQVSRDLQPPLVVQQFVEHGGVLFKVRSESGDCRCWRCTGRRPQAAAARGAQREPEFPLGRRVMTSCARARAPMCRRSMCWATRRW